MTRLDDSYTALAHWEAVAERAEKDLRLRLGVLRAAMEAATDILTTDVAALYRSDSGRKNLHVTLQGLQEDASAAITALHAYALLAERADEGSDRKKEK
jgi:hypothetical protein